MEGACPTSAPLPLINIPTTMRDAFLFTDKTPIIDARSRKTKILKTQNGLCKLALFDPNLSINMTETQIASNSIQTLCIAIEAYISQKSNFFLIFFVFIHLFQTFLKNRPHFQNSVS